MRLTYVLGVSASGKTTLTRRLVAAGLPHVVELDDVDENLDQHLPHAAHVEWLRWRALEHLHEATQRALDGVDEHHIVTGIVWPFHVVDSDAFDAASEAGVAVRFVMLDRAQAAVDHDMEARLAAEAWPVDDIVEQLTLNRHQARSLRRQVEALHTGWVVAEGDLDAAESLLAASW